MALFIKHITSGVLLVLSGMSASQAVAAITDIKANITDGSCQISVDNANITFDRKDVSQFTAGTATVLPLDINLNCVGMQGQAPSLSVSGESSGLSDTRLFRAASSSAQYVGFMLKKGTLTSLADFYNASGTVAPGDKVLINPVDGDSVEAFSVGLVRSAGDSMPTAGAVNAKITFAFIFP
ncbi:fimbrial protein [Serratia fonticola]|uniref:fimbrial protein n=1 Tax=Serratia fonticola TaxID=47917 RepID=UPI0015760934|nr:fimbrial protein [Serratia fonticola]